MNDNLDMLRNLLASNSFTSALRHHLATLAQAGAGLVDHWPDILVAAFIACLSWLLKRDISAMDKRHERAEDQFKAQGEKLGEHDTKLAVLDNRVTGLEKREQ